MTFEKWTPTAGPDPGIAMRVVDDALGEWAEKWFLNAERPRATLAAVRGTDPATPVQQECVATVGKVSLFATPTSHDAIVDRAIGIPAARLVQNAMSSELLAMLGREIVVDLATVIDNGLPQHLPQAKARHAVPGPASGRTDIVVDISASWLPRLVAAFPAPVKPRGSPVHGLASERELAGRLSCVDPQKIMLVACLGTVVLPLWQLQELQAGDVVPLDTRLDDNLPLHLLETDSVVAFGEPCADEHGICFQIKTFINRVKIMSQSHVDTVVSEVQLLPPRAEKPSDPQARVNPGVLDQLPVSVSAMLGEASMTVKALRELKEGDVIRLGTAVDGVVSITLNGTTIAAGEIVAVDQNFGVRISRIGTA